MIYARDAARTKQKIGLIEYALGRNLNKIKNCFQVWTSHYYIGGVMTPLYILGFTTTSETQATTFIPPHWTPKS